MIVFGYSIDTTAAALFKLRPVYVRSILVIISTAYCLQTGNFLAGKSFYVGSKYKCNYEIR
jgi:hypothetical protein